jgi:hypothetical protein
MLGFNKKFAFDNIVPDPLEHTFLYRHLLLPLTQSIISHSIWKPWIIYPKHIFSLEIIFWVVFIWACSIPKTAKLIIFMSLLIILPKIWHNNSFDLILLLIIITLAQFRISLFSTFLLTLRCNYTMANGACKAQSILWSHRTSHYLWCCFSWLEQW